MNPSMEEWMERWANGKMDDGQKLKKIKFINFKIKILN